MNPVGVVGPVITCASRHAAPGRRALPNPPAGRGVVVSRTSSAGCAEARSPRIPPGCLVTAFEDARLGSARTRSLLRQLLWAQGWSRYGSSARCPRNRRGWLRPSSARSPLCPYGGCPMSGLDRPIRPDQVAAQPDRDSVRSEPLPASGSAGYTRRIPFPGSMPGSLSASRRSAALCSTGPSPGQGGTVLTLSAADRRSLALRLPPWRSKSSWGVVLTRAHRPTVCQRWSPHARIRRHSV